MTAAFCGKERFATHPDRIFRACYKADESVPDPVRGMTPATLLDLPRDKVESIPLPDGYELRWGGEHEAQQGANVAVFAFVPLGVLVMIVLPFGSAKQTLAVRITVRCCSRCSTG